VLTSEICNILPCDIQAFLAYGIHERMKSTDMILKVHFIA
jgi:hypothetical protein